VLSKKIIQRLDKTKQEIIEEMFAEVGTGRKLAIGKQ
jgi:hypothetical protein